MKITEEIIGLNCSKCGSKIIGILEFDKRFGQETIDRFMCPNCDKEKLNQKIITNK